VVNPAGSLAAQKRFLVFVAAFAGMTKHFAVLQCHLIPVLLFSFGTAYFQQSTHGYRRYQSRYPGC
jgi:hypothetical protein